jgi:hypothetical protein
MTDLRYWIFRETWRVVADLGNLIGTADDVVLVNDMALFTAWDRLGWNNPTGYYGNPLIPADFIRPILRMPSSNFVPDYFILGRTMLASRKLREALAQPDHAIQYHPIELLEASVEARDQDYRWMNILACVPAIDMQESQYTIEEGTRYDTGEVFRFISSYDRMVIRDDISSTAALFRIAEGYGTVLASDALAERVMRARCIGVAFEHPETYRSLGPIHRYRTATGVEKEDMNQVYPPAP